MDSQHRHSCEPLGTLAEVAKNMDVKKPIVYADAAIIETNGSGRDVLKVIELLIVDQIHQMNRCGLSTQTGILLFEGMVANIAANLSESRLTNRQVN